MKVQISKIFEALQWFGDGDHPDVRPGGFHTMINSPCRECGKLQAAHGHIDFDGGALIFCPGDWVVDDGGFTGSESNYTRYTDKAFKAIFKEYKPKEK